MLQLIFPTTGQCDCSSVFRLELSLPLISATTTPEAYRQIYDYAQRLKRDLEPYLMGVFMNWLEGEESRERIEEAYSPQNYQRLRQLKAKYDPENLFGFSFNIQPVI